MIVPKEENWDFLGKTDTLRSRIDKSMALGFHARIRHNLYLIPKVSYEVLGDRENQARDVTILSNARAYNLSMGMYYLF